MSYGRVIVRQIDEDVVVDRDVPVVAQRQQDDAQRHGHQRDNPDQPSPVLPRDLRAIGEIVVEWLRIVRTSRHALPAIAHRAVPMLAVQAQLAQVAEVGDPLARVRLAGARRALLEGVGDLRQPRPLAAHEDFQQDLEAIGAQLDVLDHRAAEKKEAAHRIGAVAQPREERDRRRSAAARDQLPRGTVQPRAAAPWDVAARYHHIGVLRGGQQRRHQLRRVLQVAVEHADELAVGLMYAQ